jgi:hypothetical protein
MKKVLHRRPSPAMVVAMIALFVSMGGVSYGLATGSIDSREIRNNTVRSRDLRNNDTRTQDVRNNNLRGRDIRNNSLTGADILESSLGTVPSATSANSANTANSATTATTANTANIGLSPVAFARVDATGNVVEADSRAVGDGNVTLESTSAFCFRGLPFSFTTAQVTVDYGDATAGGDDGDIAMVAKGNPFGDCSGTDVQLEVATADTEAGGGSSATFQPVGFFIWFYA